MTSTVDVKLMLNKDEMLRQHEGIIVGLEIGGVKCQVKTTSDFNVEMILKL